MDLDKVVVFVCLYTSSALQHASWMCVNKIGFCPCRSKTFFV